MYYYYYCNNMVDSVGKAPEFQKRWSKQYKNASGSGFPFDFPFLAVFWEKFHTRQFAHGLYRHVHWFYTCQRQLKKKISSPLSLHTQSLGSQGWYEGLESESSWPLHTWPLLLLRQFLSMERGVLWNFLSMKQGVSCGHHRHRMDVVVALIPRLCLLVV